MYGTSAETQSDLFIDNQFDFQDLSRLGSDRISVVQFWICSDFVRVEF